MAWLAALRRDTGAPRPGAGADARRLARRHRRGSGRPRRRERCALLRWIDGRFVNRRLTPAHLALVGATMAELQAHADRAGRRPPGSCDRAWTG